MVQASKSVEAKQLILNIVTQETGADPGKIGRYPDGIGYNDLFELVNEKMFRLFNEKMSYTTYSKYLGELTDVDHSLNKRPHPTDRRAELITLEPENARMQQIFLDGVNKIKAIRFKPESFEEKDFNEWRKKFTAAHATNKLSLNLQQMRSLFMRERRRKYFYDLMKDDDPTKHREDPVYQLFKVAYEMFIQLEELPAGTFLRVTYLRNSNGKQIKVIERR
jgi:hypothetical protein